MGQMASPPASWSAAAGPAGRRLAASFSVGLARSFSQRCSAGRGLVAPRAVAASRNNCVIGLPWGPAAQGSVGDDEIFEGTDERASQEGVFNWAVKSRATPGPAWPRGRGEHPAGSRGRVMKAPGGVGILREERATGLCWAGSKFTF